MSDRFDLVVIGLGSAGLAAVSFAAHLGLRVAAIERDRPGGDCLWTGCVPSKALLASAKAAQSARRANALGVNVGEPEIDGAMVWQRVRDIQHHIANGADSLDVLTALGATIRSGQARVVSATAVDVDGELVAL